MVIYSFNQKCEIIIIQHVDNPNNNIFNKDNLETFFKVLLNANRNDSYIVQYDYNNKYYKTYNSNLVMPSALAEDGTNEPCSLVIPLDLDLVFENSNIVNIVTVKPITKI